MAKINCYQCKYFAVSWDAKSPRACRLFGFKSARMPAEVVYKSTGEECAGFKKKDEEQAEI